MIPIILSGGSGTRLWPLSRTQFPKQFLPLNSDKTMLQETVKRLDKVDTVTVICNEEHRFLAAEQMRQISQPCSIFLEPVGRNTAPAIALAALDAVAKGKGDEALLVLAADHVIENEQAFREGVAMAAPLAESGQFVTFGIVPSCAETGYGYIKREDKLTSGSYPVAAFVEKPNAETAEAYVASGEYYWNSGMFMFRADRYLEELGNFRPDILSACQAAMQTTAADFDFVRVDTEAFKACPDESIDYAVMEPLSSVSGVGENSAASVVVVPLDAGWSDVGSWSALWDIKQKDEQGNVLSGDVIAHDTRGSLVMSDDRLITTLGVDDLIIVDTKDALLVAHKDKIQNVKAIVAEIKEGDRSEHFQHREVYRPWGKYDSIDTGERYQVKRITVKPGAKLSVQMHHHRAEHWIVVSGTAKVTVDGAEKYVTENQSVYIPITAVHALENPGKVNLELIEVQSGAYLDEDDIVRFEDRYGRVGK
ncbi:mannose-1-phosphate guanylyltransferase/mannose-6-phosphate isomerase [Neptunomonas sp.]|uniref:mannose-1-phosphate guanylyltransferase/mannose-6-phosphate isomerase n=1 Tax=Neptunomonas sp. TaxID=1971898 RepID=UPI0025F87023|nr:mannose-1-phosphate guanylyltransferase/mannose-6-phosphate isomerase [Neptunomonas sp.]